MNNETRDTLGMSYQVNGVTKYLLLQNLYAFNVPSDPQLDLHIFSILLVLEDKEINLELSDAVLVSIVIAGITLIFFSLIVFVVIFKTSHALIRPLRILNTKMREVMMDDEHGESSELKADNDSSQEIRDLYRSFKDLIQDKQFSQSNFLKKPSS